MALEQEIILMSAIVFGIMLITNKLYPKNYFFQAFWLLLGTWFYGALIPLIESITISYPLLLLVFNLLINIFMLQDSIRSGDDY